MNTGLHLPVDQSAGPSPGAVAAGVPAWEPAGGPVAAGPPLPEIRPILLRQPGRIAFGSGSSLELGAELSARGLRRILVVLDPGAREACLPVIERWRDAGMEAVLYEGIDREPTVGMFEACLQRARAVAPDGVVGLGGGSAMDVAKLAAALWDSGQSVAEVFGINALGSRKTFLACVPTTAGTGSEVSPNAILLDEGSRLKQGVISPHLVPDVACVDPRLTVSVPPATTAATGLDALTHCIEAYANRFAHPMVDLYALEGIRLISSGLPAALANGRDERARTCLALGSLYGGLCLGPVNTGAVHALAYPLASRFGVAHGVSNALLLAPVLRFNLPWAVERYAAVARALGVPPGGAPEAMAEKGFRRLEELLSQCPLPRRLSALGVPRAALPELAAAAMTVTRLLKNNPRPVSEPDALEIYHAAW